VCLLSIILVVLPKLGDAIVFRDIPQHPLAFRQASMALAREACLRLNTPIPDSEDATDKESWDWKHEDFRGGGLPSQPAFITQSHHQPAARVPAVVCSGMYPALQLQPSGVKLSPNILVTIQLVCMSTLEVTQGQISSQSPTDATRCWWHLYGS